MNNKCYLILLLFFCSNLLCGLKVVEESEYYVKPYDQFFVQVVTPDTVSVETAVLPNGSLSLYPLGSIIKVADMTLADAKSKIYKELGKSYSRDMFTVDLFKIAPISFHISGAVRVPGEYVTESTVSLYQAILKGGKLLPRASRKVSLIRRGKSLEYDLSKYLIEGDVSQNPMIQNEDIIVAGFAKEFVSYFTYNDTINFIQYVEFTKGMKVSDVFKSLELKSYTTDYDNIFLYNKGQLTKVNMETELKPFDEIRTSSTPRFIYVTGYVRSPGYHFYQANKDVNYYIQKSRGTYSYSSKNYIIISSDGTEKKWKGQRIEPGDTIYVPEHWLTKLETFIKPLATIAGLAYSIVRLYEISKGRM